MHTIQPRTTRERTAYVTLALARGEKLRTADVADACGMTRQGAYKLLEAISPVVPLVLDNNEWYLLAELTDAQTPR